MPKHRSLMIAGVSGLAGLIIGAIAAAWFSSSFFGYGMTTGALANVVVEGAALEKLHAGDIDGARRILDVHLDGELLTIGYAIDDGFKLPPNGASAIARIKRMREASGYVPDPAIQSSVQAVLALGGSSN